MAASMCAISGLISIHALREEGDGAAFRAFLGVELFLSTPSARRATRRDTTSDRIRHNFYPRPPRGGRLDNPAVNSVGDISIHALREEGDVLGGPCFACCSYFYPRPPRGGRRAPTPGRDPSAQFLSTPSARRATMGHILAALMPTFLSTPSARRATAEAWDAGASGGYFYPRPPRGGRHY